MLDRFRRSVGRVRPEIFHPPAGVRLTLGFLPSLGLAVVLLVGGRQVINNTLAR
jgi:hypothetical protein